MSVSRCHGLYSARLLCPWDFPGKNTIVGCHFLLRGIFLTQGCVSCIGRQILYRLSHKGSLQMFPLWVITKYWVLFPVLYNRSLLFMYSNMSLLIPNSEFIPPSSAPQHYYLCVWWEDLQHFHYSLHIIIVWLPFHI